MKLHQRPKKSASVSTLWLGLICFPWFLDRFSHSVFAFSIIDAGSHGTKLVRRWWTENKGSIGVWYKTKMLSKVWLWLLKSDLIFRGRRSKARGSARILFLYRNGGGRVVDAEEARRTIRSTQDALQMNVLSCCTVSSQTTVLTSCQRESDLNKTNTQSTWQIEIESVMASFLRLIIRLPLYFLLSRLWLLHLSSPDNQAAC